MRSPKLLQRSFEHALVIGKFYPPHLGHCLLIRNAAAAAKFVTVVVMANSEERLPLESRVAWLRAHFSGAAHVRIVGVVDDVPVDYEDEAIWQAHIDLMRTGIIQAEALFGAAPQIDATFTSEHYGERMAKYFNATPVVVDVSRALVPTSGTAVRNDLIGQWGFLPKSTQMGLCHRIVIVGGESTGKSTLAKALTEAIRRQAGVYALTPIVSEYGREYNQLKLRVMQAQAKIQGLPEPTVFDCQWFSEEFVTIAQTQSAWEHDATAQGSPFIICDTDAFATHFWHRRYMGCDNDELTALVSKLPPRSLYILPSIDDVPFEQDGLRDGEAIRHEMHEQFKNALRMQKTTWIEVKGSVSERVAQALAAIEKLCHPFETQDDLWADENQKLNHSAPLT